MNHDPDTQPRRVCATIDTLAMTYLDGELEGADLHELEVHLTECEPCRARVDAQAATLGNLRMALAAPPAPDLLRARLAVALDGEDRSSRRRLRTWALPGAASVAAVAALAVFVVSSQPARPTEKPVEVDVVANAQRRRPLEVQGAATGPWVQRHFDPNVAVPTFHDVEVEEWGARLVDVRDREALQLFYRVTTPNGLERDVAAVIFDARGLVLQGHARQVVDGQVLLVGSYQGSSVVSLRDGDEYAYIFTSPHLSREELAALVVRSSLLTQIRERGERRR